MDRVRARKDDASELAKEGERQQNDQLRATLEAELAREQKSRRASLNAKEQELLIKQAEERLVLDVAQQDERAGLLFRTRGAVADLIDRVPAFCSVLGPLQQRVHLDPRERHVLERGALKVRHDREKRDIERERRYLEKIENRERQSLERKL